MEEAKNGDFVKVHYTGKLEDGTEFETTKDKEPLIFRIGGKNQIKGFENGVIGMKEGDKKTIKVSPQEGFGPLYEELKITINKSDVPENTKLEIGKQIKVQNRSGSFVLVTVADMDENTVTLDSNHPLAGKLLILDIELLEIL